MLHQYRIALAEKEVDIRLSQTAQAALQQRHACLYVEMELYFSCMIRKQLRFYEHPSSSDFQQVTKYLHVAFRPVMTQRCSIHDSDGPPPLTPFPIARAEKFLPHWLFIDFHKGQWQGEFGYRQSR